MLNRSEEHPDRKWQSPLRGDDLFDAEWVKLSTSIFEDPKLVKIRIEGTKAAAYDAVSLFAYVARFGRIADAAVVVRGEQATDLVALADHLRIGVTDLRSQLDLYAKVGWIDAKAWTLGVVSMPQVRGALGGLLRERGRKRDARAKSKFNPPTTIEDDAGSANDDASADRPRTVRGRSAPRGERRREQKEGDDRIETSQDGAGWPAASSSPSGGSMSVGRGKRSTSIEKGQAGSDAEGGEVSRAKAVTPGELISIWNTVMEAEERTDLRRSSVLTPRETVRIAETLRKHRRWVEEEWDEAAEEACFPPLDWEHRWWGDVIRKAARLDFIAGRDPKAKYQLLNFTWITKADNAWRVYQDEFGGRKMTEEEREQLERRQMQLEGERETERELLRDRLRRGEAA